MNKPRHSESFLIEHWSRTEVFNCESVKNGYQLVFTFRFILGGNIIWALKKINVGILKILFGRLKKLFGRLIKFFGTNNRYKYFNDHLVKIQFV